MMGYGTYIGNSRGMGYGVEHLLKVVVVILVIAFIISVIRRNRKGGYHGHWGGMCSGCGDKAVELLRERYVKGEIERAEFEQKKKDLTS